MKQENKMSPTSRYLHVDVDGKTRPTHDAEITRLTALVAEQQRQIEELEKERDKFHSKCAELRAQKDSIAEHAQIVEGRLATLQSSARQMKEALEKQSWWLSSFKPYGWKDAAEVVDAALQSAASLDLGADDGEAIGWLYYNPDTGVEFSEQHPVDSGEVKDAENVRPATADVLKAELFEAWKILEEQRAESARDLGPDWRKEAENLANAAQALSEFAWSAVSADCDESRRYLSELLASLRAAIADFRRAKGGEPTP
jgi:hypothetical protein